MNKYLKVYFFPILLILAASISFLFFIKNKVLQISREVRDVNSQIIAEKEAIHVLNAEYAFLTNPKRIKKLISKHLNLQEISKYHIIEESDLDKQFDADIKETQERFDARQKALESAIHDTKHSTSSADVISAEVVQ